ncbi:12668_t:CDS:2 [Entrophospora sp. SA101]|nr:14207_t:CDS:2 [Entrophospora sp. SA101]CAJ0838084.1 12668_t:CDS:2 [Entrophospora sp. SA101]
MSSFSIINEFISNHPLIDNHCHNLLKDYSDDFSLVRCFTEANYNDKIQLKDTVIETLSFKRGIKQLLNLLNINDFVINDLNSVNKLESLIRNQFKFQKLCEIYFNSINIQCLLLDDGVSNLAVDKLESLDFHSKYVENIRRVVRIESISEQILNELSSLSSQQQITKAFLEKFNNEISQLYKSNQIIAFKSISAYQYITNIKNSSLKKLNNKILIDFIINETFKIAIKYDLPIQFHTGFGDNDLDLLLANPLHLRPLIEKFPDVKIVLLHSSYPYTCEADGHFLPETYYLATVQTKEILSKVLTEFVDSEYLNVDEALNIVKNILFENSNKLYKLNLTPKLPESTFSPLQVVSAGKHVKLITDLKSKGVKFVRLGFMDYCNLHRIRLVPIDRFFNDVVNNGLSCAKALFGLPFYMDTVSVGSGVGVADEMLLFPDLNTIKQIPYHPSHAHCHAFMKEKDASRSGFPLCTRTLLKNVLDKAEKEHGLKFLCGFENEFILIKDKLYHHHPKNKNKNGSSDKESDVDGNDYRNEPKPIDKTTYCLASSFSGRSATILDEIVESIQNQDILVEQFHSESAFGQFEIVTAPYDPLTTVDKLIVTRRTIYDVAKLNDIRATFLPKPFKDQEFFIAGVISHIKSLCAITLPTKSSYDRITVEHSWAGEAPIRICKNSVSGINFEFKFVDATSNPYLAVAAIISAGIDGIVKKLALNTKPISIDPGHLSDEERKSNGIEKLPATLKESLDSLKQDKVLIKCLGEKIIQCYVAVKELKIYTMFYLKNIKMDTVLVLQMSTSKFCNKLILEFFIERQLKLISPQHSSKFGITDKYCAESILFYLLHSGTFYHLMENFLKMMLE